MRGHVRGRGPNTFEIIVYIGRDPATGKERRHYETFHGTKSDAQNRCAQLISQYSTGQLLDAGRITFGEFLERWYTDHVVPHLREKTRRLYRGFLDRHLLPHLGRIPLQKVTPALLQRYYNDIKQRGRFVTEFVTVSDGATRPVVKATNGPLSAGSVRGQHRMIHAALETAVKWRLLAYNPADGVELPTGPRRKAAPLSRDQALHFLDVIRGHERFGLYLAALTCGARQGEILGLRWRDYDESAGVFAIRQQVSEAGRNPRFGPVKTEAGERVVPVVPDLADELRRIRKEQVKARLKAGPRWRDYDLIFATKYGGPIGARNLTRQYKGLLRQAGLPAEVRFHDLRHTVGRLLVGVGVHMKTIQELLGHAQASTTANIYAHTDIELEREAVSRIAALILPPKIRNS